MAALTRNILDGLGLGARTAFALAGTVMVGGEVLAQDGPWREQTRLLAGDPSSGDEFGQAVAVDGDLAVVGNYRDDDLGTDAGAAYIYARQSLGEVWRQEAKLLASDGAVGDRFGWLSVDIDGNLAVVGATYNDALRNASGAAYVFRRKADGEWVQEAQLLASDGESVVNFGKGVAICGQRIVVGAPERHSREGGAYVFERQSGGTWIETAILVGAPASENAYFGSTVSVDHDLIVIGAPEYRVGGRTCGATFVFRLLESGQWIQEAKLTASDATEYSLGQPLPSTAAPFWSGRTTTTGIDPVTTPARRTSFSAMAKAAGWRKPRSLPTTPTAMIGLGYLFPCVRARR